MSTYRMPSFSHAHDEMSVTGICPKKLMLTCLDQDFSVLLWVAVVMFLVDMNM